jgi:hypothetical protein
VTRAKNIEIVADLAATQQVEALKERLRQVAVRLCEDEGHCDTAVSRTHKSLSLGPVPASAYYRGEVVLSYDGQATTSKFTDVFAYSDEGAKRRHLAALGIKSPLPQLEPIAAPGTETPELLAYMADVRTYAEQQAPAVGKATVNKYLTWLGIEPLPVMKRFTFKQPAVNVMSYVIDAATEAEAREKLAALVANDMNRDPAKVNASATRWLFPIPGDAELHGEPKDMG